MTATSGIAGHPKRIVVVDPEDGSLVREVGLGDDSENACGLHVETDSYWIRWKSEATIEEGGGGPDRVRATYPAMPRIAGLTKTAQCSLVHRLEEGLFVGIDLPSGMEIARLQLEGNPTGLCWDGSRFWYSDYSGRRICGVRLDEE